MGRRCGESSGKAFAAPAFERFTIPMKTPLALVTVFALLWAVPALRADEAADQAAVREAEKSCAAALVKADYQALGEFFSEDWQMVDPAGQTATREQIFKALNAGELKFVSYELGELNVRVIGDTAVVIGHGHPRGQFHGEPFEENEVFTDTFVRVGGKWRCVLSHTTDVESK